MLFSAKSRLDHQTSPPPTTLLDCWPQIISAVSGRATPYEAALHFYELLAGVTCMIRICSSLGRARAGITGGGPRTATSAIEAQAVQLSRRRRWGECNSTARSGSSRSYSSPTSSTLSAIVDRRRKLPPNSVVESTTSFAWRRLEVAGSNRLLSSSSSSSATSGGDGKPSFSVLPPRLEEEAAGSVKDSTASSLSQLLPETEGQSRNIADIAGGVTSVETPSSSLLSTIAAEGADAEWRLRRTRNGNQRPPHFLSPINRSEAHLMRPPMATLHNEYKQIWAMEGRKDLASFDLDKCYSFKNMELDGETMYHATFTCPSTGLAFESGTPVGSQDFQSLPGSASDFVTFTTPLKKGDSSSTAKSRTFYGSKSTAKNAAAARAIDCLSLREFRLQKGEGASHEQGKDVFRMCAEEPILHTPILAPSPSSAGDTRACFMSPNSVRKFTSPIEFIHNNLARFHPELFASINGGSKGSVVERFSQLEREVLPDEDPKYGSMSSTWLTARYTDPVSGKVFRSGTLAGSETKILGNEVYYKGKKEALKAAAARAIDSLSLREFKRQNGDDAIPSPNEVMRLCAEEPCADFTDIPFDQRSHSPEMLTTPPKPPMDPNDPSYYFLSPSLSTGFSEKNILHNMMHKFHSDLRDKVSRSFQSEVVETDEHGTEWWTAKYSDPLSGQTFEAGTLITATEVEGTTNYPRVSKVINGNVCYEYALVAERAAAARAIDCLSLREFQKQRGKDVTPTEGDVMRYCMEEPFTDFDYTTYEERNPVDDMSKDSDYFMSAIGHLASKTHYTSAKEFLMRNYATYQKGNTSPQYRSFLAKSNKALISLTKGDGDGGDYWWTSTFKCPLSGEEFPSGTLCTDVDTLVRVIDSEVCYESQKLAEQAACARAVDNLSFREFVKRRDEGVNVGEDCIMRLCKEEPYLSALDRPAPLEPPTKGNMRPSASRHIVLPPSLNVGQAQMSKQLATGISADSVDFVSIDTSAKVSTVGSDALALDNIDDVAEEEEEKEDDDDDYVVQTLPNSFSTISSNIMNTVAGLTTMERVLEAWIETSSGSSGSSVMSIAENTSLPGSELAPPRSKSSTMVTISHALSWFNRLENGVEISGETSRSTMGKKSKFEQKHTIGTLLQMPVSVNACNALLRALADANSRLSFGEQNQLTLDDTGFILSPTTSTTMPTEKHDESGFLELIARQLLDRMHDTQTSDEAMSSKRSARASTSDTYNAYIGCLCRESPAATAVAAENVLMTMLDDEEKEIPRPNIDTFNAVIERWASVPGHDSWARIKEIYNELLQEGDRIDAAICAGDSTLTVLRPNRNTYLSAMAGLTQPSPEHQDGQLFPEHEAKFWLEQMESLAEKYEDDTLRPDAEAYNAPLRWSGDQSSSQQTCSHWDDYASIYKDGFQEEETHDGNDASLSARQEDAEATERWVLHMEELGKDNDQFSPTIQSYESVVQAWARTGTYQGLLRAEQWAQRAIEAASLGDGISQIQPRLQTFHPILASWAYCGWPERVQQWSDTLHELSSNDKSMAGVTPDGRIQEALIVAWQKRLELSPSSSSSDEPASPQSRLATSVEVANACMACLEHLCAQAKNQVGDRNDLRIAFDASSVERVIGAWAHVAHCAAATSIGNGLETTNEDDPSATPTHALMEMVRAVELVNEVIDLYRSTPTDGLDEKASEKYQYHMNHLMSKTPQMYAKAIRHIYEANQITSGAESSDTKLSTHVESLLPSVEKMLRRCHFYNIALIPRREFRSENEVLTYRDSFSYGSGATSNQGDIEGGQITGGHPLRDIYSAVLDICTSMEGTVYSGDAFRLAMMVQKQLAITNRMNDDEEKEPQLHERALSVIDNLVEDDIEKLAIQQKLQTPESRNGFVDDDEDTFANVSSPSTVSFASESSDISDNEEVSSLATKKAKKRIIVKRRFPVSGRRATRGTKRRR